MECECDKRVELEGPDAREYADGHLEKLEVDTAQWTVRYVCPQTGRPWLMDYPHSEYHGGGSPHLRQLQANGSLTQGQN